MSNPIRSLAQGIAAAVMVAVLALTNACGSNGGVASTVPTVSARTDSPPGTPLGTTTTASGAPTCEESPDRLTAPTGTPMITVTQGANSWITNSSTEPLALALYPDGSGLASRGIGEASKPLAEMRLGYVPSCVMEWAKSELEQLATLDMGEAGITDQGTTTVTYHRAAGDPVKISVYALGLGDRYVTSGRQNRARLTSVITALLKPFDRAATWTPTRLKIVEMTGAVSRDEALVWPGSASLEHLLIGRMGSRPCGVVAGADVAAVLKTLGQRDVDSTWIDAGTVTRLNIGALVPGQDGCAAS